MFEIIPIYLAAGVFSGFVSGLFGVGGAFVLAPALIITLTFQGAAEVHVMHLTIATSLATQLVTAILTSILRYRAGDLSLPLLRKVAPYIAGGALIGSAIGDALPGYLLKIFFICFVGFTIIRSLYSLRRTASRDASGDGNLSDVRGPGLWFFGTLSGISGALVGPGPAIVFAPFLRQRGFVMPVVAAASATLAGLVGLTAAGGYIVGGLGEANLPANSIGYLYVPGFIGLAIGALAGSPLGIRFSHRISDALQFRLFIGYLCLVLATMLAHSL